MSTVGRYAHCRTMMDLGEQFAADVDLKSAVGDLAAVRSLVAEYRARRAELDADDYWDTRESGWD